jgi:hypothetical protein
MQNIEHPSQNSTKNQNLNVRPEILRLLEENIGETLKTLE